jgi:hypothetical protein
MLIEDIVKALARRLVGDGTVEIYRLVHPDCAELAFDFALAMNGDAAARRSRLWWCEGSGAAETAAGKGR